MVVETNQAYTAWSVQVPVALVARDEVHTRTAPPQKSDGRPNFFGPPRRLCYTG